MFGAVIVTTFGVHASGILSGMVPAVLGAPSGYGGLWGPASKLGVGTRNTL